MAESVVEVLIKVKGAADQAIRNFSKRLEEAKRSANNLGKAKVTGVDSAIRSASEGAKELGENITKVSRASVQKVTKQVSALSAGIKKALENSKELGKSLDETGKSIRDASVKATAFGAAIGAPLALGVNQFADFERTLARVRAIIGDISDETFQELINTTRELGETTSFSAQEAAQGLTFLAQAGLEATEAQEALPGTLQLAIAGTIDLASAADLATNVLAAFRLEVNQLPRVNNVIAKTASSANTNVFELATALQSVGGIAAASGESLEEVTSLLGALADTGIKGAEAGRAVRNILIRLQKPSGEAAEALERLNVQTTDSEGKFRGAATVLNELGEAGLNAADAQRIFGAFTATAGINAANATATIARLNQSLGEGGRNAEGFAANIQAILTDTLTGDIKQLNSALGELGLIVGEALAPSIRSFIQTVTDGVRAVSAWSKENPELSKTLISIVKAISSFLVVGGVLGLVVGGLVTGLGKLLLVAGPLFKFFTTWTGFAGAATAALALFRKGIGLLLIALRGLIAHPVIATMAAIAFVVIKVANAISEAKEQAEQFQEALDDVNRAADNVREIGVSIEEAGIDKLQQFKEALIEASEATENALNVAIETEQSEEEVNGLIDSLNGYSKQLVSVNEAIVQTAQVQEDAAQKENFRKGVERTTESVGELSDQLAEVNRKEFEDLIGGLEKVRDISTRALIRQGNFQAAQAAEKRFSTQIVELARQRAEQQLEIAERRATNQKELLDREVTEQKENAKLSRDIFNKLGEDRIKIEQEVATVVEEQLNRSEKAAQKYADQVISLEEKIRSERERQEDVLANITKVGQTETEIYASDQIRSDKLISDARRALTRGDFEEAARLARKAESIGASLARAVSEEDGQKVITETQGRANALKRVGEAQELINGALNLQKTQAEELRDAELKRSEELTNSLEKLNENLKGLTDEKLGIDLELNTGEIEAALTGLAEKFRAIDFNINIEEATVANVQQVLNEIDENAGRPKIIRLQPQDDGVQTALEAIPDEKIVRVKFVPVEGSGIPGLEVAQLKGGGQAKGPGTGSSDSIFARLSNGEFVVRAAAVRKYGLGLMHSLNQMRLPPNRLPSFALGGPVLSDPASFRTESRTPVNLNFPDGSSFPLEGEPGVVDSLALQFRREAMKFGRRK